MTDKELIDAIRDGKTNAIDILIDKYYPEIYQFIFRKTFNIDDACDITQETFVKLVNTIHRFRNGNFRGYLFTVANNACMDYFRKRKRTTERWNPLEDFHEIADPQSTPEEVIEKHQEIQEARRLLGKLSPEQRDVVVLRIYHALELKEIAKILGIPLSRVKNRLYAGFERLKKEAEHDETKFSDQI